MKYVCKNCRHLTYGRYCNRTYKEDKYYYGWVSLAEYVCTGRCKYYKPINIFYKIKNIFDFFKPMKKSQGIKKEIIIKTKLSTLPVSCKDCQIHIIKIKDEETITICPILKKSLSQQDIKNGKIKFSNCPLEETK